MVTIQKLKVQLLRFLPDKLFLIFLFLYANYAFSQEVFVTYYSETKNIRESFEGMVINGDTVKNGLYKIYHKNDSLWQIGSFRSGALTGKWLDYFPSGLIKQKLYFEKGELEDTSYSYYESGGRYQVNVYKKDLLNGECRTYYENGFLKSENFYLNNQKSGPQKSYYKNGNIKEFYNAVSGQKLGDNIVYYKSTPRKVQKECSYNRFGLNGKMIGYYESGKKMNESFFLNDTIHGPYKEFFDSALVLLSIVGEYEKGEKSGFWRTYYPNSETYIEGAYKKSKRDGEWKIYYPNKNLKQKGSYFLGKESGKWMFFSENGKLNQIGYYSDGTRVGQWNSYYYKNQLKSIFFYHNGKKNGMAYGYGLDGKLIEKAFYVDDEIYYSN